MCVHIYTYDIYLGGGEEEECEGVDRERMSSSLCLWEWVSYYVMLFIESIEVLYECQSREKKDADYWLWFFIIMKSVILIRSITVIFSAHCKAKSHISKSIQQRASIIVYFEGFDCAIVIIVAYTSAWILTHALSSS